MWYVVFNHFFLKLFFLICWIFFFHDTYNIWLKERYGDDTSTHPDLNLDLWWKAGSPGGPDINLVHGLFRTTTEDLRITHNVSTIGCSHSVLSTQTSEFNAISDQWVQAQTTHFAIDFERLSAELAKLCRLVMKMRS